MGNMEYITKSANETQEVGERLGADLGSGPVVFALEGDLGSGKTTFVQGLAKGMGIEGRVISPTFMLMRKYQIRNPKLQLNSKSKNNNLLNLYHVDLYRLEDNLEGEIENFGLTDIWKDPKNVVLIEWAEKIRDYLPRGTRWVRFEYMGESQRKIVVND